MEAAGKAPPWWRRPLRVAVAAVLIAAAANAWPGARSAWLGRRTPLLWLPQTPGTAPESAWLFMVDETRKPAGPGTPHDRAWQQYGWTATSVPGPVRPVTDDELLAGCAAILENVKVHRNVTIGRGTVKDVYLGSWGPAKEPVAVLRLRNPAYQGDFSSGLSRLRYGSYTRPTMPNAGRDSA